MARFQPHRTPEEGQQSHSYLLAFFQRLPQNEAAGPLSQNPPLNALLDGPPVAVPGATGLLAGAQRTHVLTVSEPASSIPERADLERENVGRMCLF